MHVLAERLLAPVRDAKVDTLLFGCTHYPYLARTISDVMGRDVVLVASADETAFEVRHMLVGTDLEAPPIAAGDERPPSVLLVRRHRVVLDRRRPLVRSRARARGAGRDGLEADGARMLGLVRRARPGVQRLSRVE